MTPEHAHNLATRYKNIWRGGPSPDELRTQLANHDFDPACAAISRLAREHDTPPTIRQLVEAIRIATPTPPPPPANTGNIIDPADYWQKIQTRADLGDADAIAQLASYRRITHRQ